MYSSFASDEIKIVCIKGVCWSWCSTYRHCIGTDFVLQYSKFELAIRLIVHVIMYPSIYVLVVICEVEFLAKVSS